MATTTMHFGPEWMRAKPQTPARHQPPPSPPLPPALTAQQPSVSTYSALVTPAAPQPEKRDESRPFRYTKEEMLRIYKEGGGRGGLGLEVERWEGIVRDVGSEPAGLREMGEAEKKLFAGPLNSELRRRQSTDLMNTFSSQSDRSRLNHAGTSGGSPMRERFGSLMGRRREGTDQPPLTLPRKLSLSGSQGGPLASPRDSVLPSPRNNRMGSFGSGFDGVLNSGDTWTRKRPSAGVTGAGGSISTRGEGKEDEFRGSGIKEEEEELGRRVDSGGSTQSSSPVPCVPPPGRSTDGRTDSSLGDQVIRDIAAMSLEADNVDPNPATSHAITAAISGPPPGLDPTSVEWSYLDPQGQVQGPFRADVMQKWFDEGYFTADLLMKRTNMDADWITVGELERRVGGGKIFLSRLSISSGPPALTVHTDSPQGYSPIHEQNAFNGYQPVPTRNLRAATLDSYLNNASPSESSTESFGAGRFGNGSPDPSVFGGRVGSNMYSGDPTFGTRGFGGVRAPFQDQVTEARSFNSVELARTPSIDTFNNGGVSPWPTAHGQTNQGFSGNEQHPFSNGFSSATSGMTGGAVPINQVHGFNQETFGDPAYTGMGSLADHHDSPLSRPPVEGDGMTFGNSMLNGLNGSHFGGPSIAQYPQTPPVPYAPSQQHQSVSPFGEILQHATESPGLAHTPASVQPHSASPWATDLSAIRRPRTFDGPTDTSPVAPPAPQGLSWATPQPLTPVNDPSPWLVASGGSVDDVWKEIPGPNSLTFSNVGQHNKLQEQEEEAGDISVSPIEGVAPTPATQQLFAEPIHPVPAVITVPVPPVPSNSEPVTAATLKTRRKSTVREAQGDAAVPKPVVPPPPPHTAGVKSPSPTPATAVVPPKAAWATEEEKKPKPTGATMGLREIQEAEARKAEARKAAEKERERVARANAVVAVSTPEESQATFTGSWGLPTSQAGIRSVIPPKEAPASSSTPSVTPGVPVWMNSIPAPAAKKTMKEIQEEEERKKKTGVKESMASAAARRAYAETTVKVVTPSAQASGGAWTTVGANGKSNAAAAAPRSAVAQPSTTGVPSAAAPRVNGGTTRAPTATVAKVAGPSRVEEFPVTPSHDFLKWLTESLKGLNSSVNLEEITSMLLSFPLDPDSSTVEIISDLIYANSTTLNGRRFATEYVSKRKADAAARRGTTGTTGAGGKSISIADVVKAQPKPVQQEWGFKVVNKKKKGGRT
ncbi:hypothetical protein F5I97DRAFT_1813828 [Phlebopus sp. FC_14]|nr:hypothetical protein F5I97DRAFT_1813828 [Phlebopus sp. FC_14]